MEAKDCIRFDGCNVPLCPRDEESLSNGSWFPDEPICPLQAFCKEPWIINQKKIAKQARNVEFYFTLRMLKHSCVIGRGIEGIIPDHDISERDVDEDHWLIQHPQKRKLTEAEKVERGLRLKRVLDLKNIRVNCRENSRSNSQSSRDITVKL